MIYDIAELAKQIPDAKRLSAPAIYGFRPKLATVDPTAMSAGLWRALVAKAPIVRNCISTLILQLIAVPYEIACEDEDKKAYYESVFDHANDEDFDTFLVRLIQDTMTVPFGGAFEPLRYSDGTLYSLYHVDGGTLFPTYDEKLPYVQVDPRYTHNRIYFSKDELMRVSWMMRPDLQNYGWSFTPSMDCYSAIESLIRTDIFYNTLLSDTPPPGILDLLDMSKDEAEDWAKSFRLTFEGIDRFKIPILYEHEKEAKWIPFQESSTLKELPNIIRRYAEIVTSSFGMSIVDLGLYEYSQTRAGSTVQIEASKRQGLGSLMGRIKTVFNGRLLPDDVEFKWNPVDEEDRVRRATAQKLRVEAVAKAVEMGIIDAAQAQKMLVADGIFIIEMPGIPASEIQGEEETEGEVPEVQGEEETEEKSLYGLVLDDGMRLRYPWEECEEQSETTDWKPRAFDPDDKSYARMRKLFEKAFARINRRISLSLVSRAVDAAWGDFPEPEEKAQSYDMETFAKIRAIVGGNGNLSDGEVSEVVSILGEAYQTGLEKATDTVWKALTIGDIVSGDHGIAFSIENPETMRMLKENAITLASNVDQGTTSLVSRLIYTGVRDGKAVYGGKKSIAASIHQALPDVIGKRRARSIALFEVNKIQSEAHRKEYQTIGLQKKHWVSISSIACDICKRNDGRGFIGMEETFETVFGPAQGPPGHPQVCVLPGTMVLLGRGRQRPIEEIRKGDRVFDAYHGSNFISTVRPVLLAKDQQYDGEVVRIELEDGRILECLPTHEIFTKNGWRRADALAENDDVIVYPNLECLHCGKSMARHRLFCSGVCRNRWTNGKSYEQLYGEHGAEDMRIMQARTKGRPYIERFTGNEEFTANVKHKVGTANRGRRQPESERRQRGESVHRAYAEGRAIAHDVSGDKNPAWGKSWEEYLGVEKAAELRKSLQQRNASGVMKIATCLRHCGPSCLENEIIGLSIEGLWYCGNGHYWVRLPNGKLKVPDFKVHGQKKVIEVLGNYWHKVRRDTKPAELQELYALSGFDCLVIEEFEFGNMPALKEKIERFAGEGQVCYA